MKKKIYGVITVMCLLFAVWVMSGYSTTASVCAASRNSKAKKAFKQYLSQDMVAWPTSEKLYAKEDYTFKYMELGKKKIPILIVSCSKTCHAEGYVAVLQYVNGKVKYVFANDWVEAVYPKSGMIATCHSGGGYGEINTWYYKLNSKGKFGKSVAYTAILSDAYLNLREYFGEDKYEIGSKNVSKVKFESWLKKKTNGEKGKSCSNLYKNTQRNRNKYLK